jgi:putative DNA-invertase from lambdoid prophage Rac
MADARARKFDCLLVWKLDRFGRSLVDCLNNIQALEECGVRFIAVTQRLDTDVKNPASRFLLHVLGAAAEFERALIRERTQAGRLRYQQDYAAGRVGNGVYSRSGRNLPPHRPRRIFDRDEVLRLRSQGLSYRAIARKLGLGLGTVTRTLLGPFQKCIAAFWNDGASLKSQVPRPALGAVGTTVASRPPHRSVRAR